jgi:two-component system, OmpR family, sensor kinase
MTDSLGKQKGRSIFSLTLLLTLGSALALAAASVLVVLSTRPDFIFPFGAFEVARLLKGEPIVRSLAGVEVKTVQAAPDIGPPRDVHETAVRDALARHLNADPARLRFVMLATAKGGYNPPIEIAREEYELVMAKGASLYADDPQFSPLIFGGFRAAYLNDAGQWRVASFAGAPLGPQWQESAVRLIVLALALLAPIAWGFAALLANPIKALASAAHRIGAGEDTRIEPQGPREIQIAARAMNEMQDRLKRHLQERTGVVGAIAHDMRTPLARLAFILEAAPAPLRARAALEVKAMERMIATSLDYVRGQASDVVMEQLDLRLLIESVVDDFIDQGAAVQFAPGPRQNSTGDAALLRRLFENLIGNAIAYGSRADVTLEQVGAGIVIEIHDAGPGLPQSQLEQVFEPFFRGEASRNDRTGGIGLGLAIARGIARRHHGEVVLRNHAKGGLIAKVTLPLKG